MRVSRYQTALSQEERFKFCSQLEDLARKPYEGNEDGWHRLMNETVRLPLCYLDGVRKAIEDGRWRAKLDPIAFIRKAGQSGTFTTADERKNRQKVYVGRAIDPEQKRALTLEESLKFDKPYRRPYAYAGSIADLRLPAAVTTDGTGKRLHWASAHDHAIDFFAFRNDCDYYERPRKLPISPEILLPAGDEDGDQKIDWARVAGLAKLDEGERLILEWKLGGHSRDSVIAIQKTLKQRRFIQAAWRRFDRKWPRVVDIIKGSPTKPVISPRTPAKTSFVPPAEVLRQLNVKQKLTRIEWT